MANVFLPFISESSSEETVFKAILKRSKGSSVMAISNLYAVVTGLGIEVSRKKMSSYPDSLTTSDKIKELVSQNTNYHIINEEGIFWVHMLSILHANGRKKTSSLEKFQEEIMFSVLAVNKPQALSEYMTKEEHAKYRVFSKTDFDADVLSLSKLSFSQKSETRIGFLAMAELKAFTAFVEASDVPMAIFPVFVTPEKAATPVTGVDYERLHCKPYYEVKINET